MCCSVSARQSRKPVDDCLDDRLAAKVSHQRHARPERVRGVTPHPDVLVREGLQ
jgi:hypothetical protein